MHSAEFAVLSCSGCSHVRGARRSTLRIIDSILGSSRIDIGGFELEFGRGDNQGSDKVFTTVIGFDGEYHAVESLQEAEAWLN